MSERIREGATNPQFKRGIIKENDPIKVKSRVEFQDEDGTVSYWLNVNQMASGENKSYWMPDLGAQVNCLVDWQAEDGTVIGALYSDADPPPTEDGDTLHIRTKAGTDIIVNRKTGDITISGAKTVAFQAESFTFTGNVDFNGGYVKSNGHAIDDTHRHTDVDPGPALSGPPE